MTTNLTTDEALYFCRQFFPALKWMVFPLSEHSDWIVIEGFPQPETGFEIEVWIPVDPQEEAFKCKLLFEEVPIRDIRTEGKGVIPLLVAAKEECGSLVSAILGAISYDRPFSIDKPCKEQLSVEQIVAIAREFANFYLQKGDRFNCNSQTNIIFCDWLDPLESQIDRQTGASRNHPDNPAPGSKNWWDAVFVAIDRPVPDELLVYWKRLRLI